MRTYEEIYDLFVDLIKGNIDEIKVTFAEMKMLDKKILSYMPYIGGGKVGFGCIGRRYNYADIIRKLCKKNFDNYNNKIRPEIEEALVSWNDKDVAFIKNDVYF